MIKKITFSANEDPHTHAHKIRIQFQIGQEMALFSESTNRTLSVLL